MAVYLLLIKEEKFLKAKIYLKFLDLVLPATPETGPPMNEDHSLFRFGIYIHIIYKTIVSVTMIIGEK